MMRRLFYTFMVAIAMQSLVSCDIEMSGNGDLDGYWHLVSVDTLSTSGRSDLSQELLFWSFQHNIMSLRDCNNVHHIIISRFQKTDGGIRLYHHCLDMRHSGDSILKDTEHLTPYGVNDLDETFNIESLNSNRMELKSQILRLRFVKM